MPETTAVTFSDECTVSVEDRPVPEPDEGEVLIETERSLVSTGTELAMLDGSHQPDNLPDGNFPIDPGYSNVGRVREIGPGVDEALRGTRVLSATPHASHVTAAAADCVPVPAELSPVAATFGRLAGVSMNAVRRGGVEWGESAAVRGLGLVGQLALRTCLVAGAAPVYAIDVDPDRIAATPDHGRVEPIRVGGEDDPSPEAITDVVVDATGNPDTLADGISLLREDGRFVVVGCPRRTVEFDVYRDCIVPSAHIIGAYRIPAGGQGPWDPPSYAELFFEYLRGGDLAVESMVTTEPDAADAPAVYEALLADRSGELGVVFDWS